MSVPLSTICNMIAPPIYGRWMRAFVCHWSNFLSYRIVIRTLEETLYQLSSQSIVEQKTYLAQGYALSRYIVESGELSRAHAAPATTQAALQLQQEKRGTATSRAFCALLKVKIRIAAAARSARYSEDCRHVLYPLMSLQHAHPLW